MDLTASWSDLDASAKQKLWLSAMVRVDQLRSISDVRYIPHDPTDRLLPIVQQLMERKLAPCGREVALEAVGLACQILRCKRPEGDVLEGYVLLLQDYPRDLLMPSIKEALEQERYHVLPTPGALLAKARVVLAERREKFFALQHVLRRIAVSNMFKLKGRTMMTGVARAVCLMVGVALWEMAPSMTDPPRRLEIGFIEANGGSPPVTVVVNRLSASNYFKGRFRV